MAGAFGLAAAATSATILKLTGSMTLAVAAAADKFETAFPAIAGYVRSRYSTLAVVPVTDELAVTIFIDGMLAPSGRDGPTGWPCFR